MREKLIDLLDKASAFANDVCGGLSCDECEGGDGNGCTLLHVADHLINLGVRIPVLCEFCEHFKPGDDGIYYCKRDKLSPGKFMKKDDFCSYGERKADHGK